nr:uncharacterized protein LOC128702881 isoform X1 [Cherax quadricarinatus]
MSVKHIDFLKIKSSKLLVVEIRPVRCIFDTASGPTRTAKWMNYYHWKELRKMINDIADKYEEKKSNLNITEDIECNKPLIKVGSLIKIGYMFTTFRKCSCHYLTPRDSNIWTDDEDDDNEELKDKGGRYDSFVPCGEMLVVSVTLLNSGEDGLQEDTAANVTRQQKIRRELVHTRSMSSPVQHERLLLKALDSSIVFPNKISDYFESSQKLSAESSSNGNFGNNEHEKLKKMASKSRIKHRKQKVKESTAAIKFNVENENPNKRQVLNNISSDNCLEACQKDQCILPKGLKDSLQSFSSCKSSVSHSILAFDSDIDNQITDDESQSQNDRAKSQLFDLDSISVEVNRTGVKKYSDIVLNDSLPSQVKPKKKSKVLEVKKCLNNKNKYNEKCLEDFSKSGNITRSYLQTSKKKNTVKAKNKFELFKASVSPKKNCEKAHKRALKIESVSSRSPSPVLGTSRKKSKKNASDVFFCPQVTNQTEGKMEVKDFGFEDRTHAGYNMGGDDATESFDFDLSEELPDLTRPDPSLQVKILLSKIDSKEKILQFGLKKDTLGIINSSPKLGKDIKGANAKRKLKEEKKSSDENHRRKSLEKLSKNTEETYPSKSKSHADIAGSVCRRSVRIKEMEGFSSQSEAKIKESTTRNSESDSIDFNNDQPLIRKTLQKSKPQFNDVISGCDISSLEYVQKSDLLSENSKKSLAILEKCHKAVELLNKHTDKALSQDFIYNVSQDSNNLPTDIKIKPETKKCNYKSKLFAVPENQPKVTDWITNTKKNKNNPSNKVDILSKASSDEQFFDHSKTMNFITSVVKKISSADLSPETKKTYENSFSTDIDKVSSSTLEASCSDDATRSSESTYFKANLVLSSEINLYGNVCSQMQSKSEWDKRSPYEWELDEPECSYSERTTINPEHMNSFMDFEENLTMLQLDNSLAKSQQGLSSEDENSVLVTNEERCTSPSLASKISSYNRLQNMTIEELQKRVEKTVPYLRRVTKEQEPSERHQVCSVYIIAFSNMETISLCILISRPQSMTGKSFILSVIEQR